MTTRQLNKLAAFAALVSVCRKAQSTWSSLKAFSDSFAKFAARVDKLDELKRKQAEVTTGIAAAKQRCREEVCASAATVAAAVRVWAEDNGNLEVTGKVNFSYSNLIDGRDTVSSDKCQTVHDVANENVSALGKYGINADKLEELQEKVDAYKKCLTKPREAITTGRTVTNQLAIEFGAADKLLTKGLDELVLQFETTAPIFFQDYQNARVVVATAATRSTTAENVEPLKKAA